jgi:hypothetical protein
MPFSTKEKKAAYQKSEKYRAVKKAFREKHKESIAAYNKAYQQEYRNRPGVKQAAIDRARKYRKENPLRVRAALRKCKAERYKSDKNYRIAESLRARLNNCLRGKVKKSSAVRDLGCTLNEFVARIESMFQPGMSWENWGSGPGSWQLDHIFPLAWVNLEDATEQRAACHHRNLQPLWFEDNASKGDGISAIAQNLFIELKEVVSSQG